MHKEADLEALLAKFESILPRAEGYCDVSQETQTLLLNVQDCWAGLIQAKSLNWVSFTADDERMLDLEIYSQLDDPLNADMHVIVPGKLIAMRGPKDLAGAPYADILDDDGSFLCRDFSPAHMADILTQFDVSTVVRLNEPCYDAAAFREHGIAVAELFFDDCTPPSALVVAKFLAIAESVPGALAVHCKAGLGRTGTLIALYMMKHHGFSARAAIGWLRIVRPGSVIGDQQQFLIDKEPTIARNRHHSLALGILRPAAALPAEQVQDLVDRTAAALQARFLSAAVLLSAAMHNSEGSLVTHPDPAAPRPGHEVRRSPSDSSIDRAAAWPGGACPREESGGEEGRTGGGGGRPTAREVAAQVERAANRRCWARATSGR